jgi:phosphopantetheinyl transferase
VYRPNLPVGTRVRCDVRITEILPQTVKVDMCIFDGEGRVWMRVCGWQDWRFHIIGKVYDFWRFPNATVMSTPFPVPLPPGLGNTALTCYRMDTFKELGQTMVTKCLAYMALNHAERRVYHGLHGPDTRQIEWLAGRIAAKDAVRVYLRQRYGLQVGPGDIEIGVDAYGRPVPRGAWLQQVGTAPSISLAHTDGSAIAVAGDGQRIPGVGIDLQRISPRPEEFDASAFDRQELALLQASNGPARDERRMRFWCAKEAVAKALGRGLIEGPRSVAIETWSEATGIAGVSVRGALAAAFPHLAHRQIAAYTVRDGDYIIATSCGETLALAEHRS